MSLASGILFFCWVVIVVVAIGGWLCRTIDVIQHDDKKDSDTFDQGDIL
tara:strand:+ start:296 stop:442 length:147 start_codon:yes stop_codon:yes gene_type:complete